MSALSASANIVSSKFTRSLSSQSAAMTTYKTKLLIAEVKQGTSD